MRLVYFGSGAFGLPTLEALARAHEILAIVTQPDRPAGRGGHLTPTPVAAWAAEHLPSARMIKPAKVNVLDVVGEIRPLRADAFVVIAFGQKLGAALLDRNFALNLHASLLPRWRGAAPIAAAILAGDTQTGNSVITLADRMDAGLILGQSRRAIDPLITAGELHDLLAADGPALVQRVLDEYARGGGELKAVAQDESLVTIASKLDKSAGAIDFALPADFLRRQIHALTPWPGVAVSLVAQPDDPPATPPIKLLRVQESPEKHQQLPPGSLMDALTGLVSCGRDTTLRILDVQPAGKRPMSWSDYARGASKSLAQAARLISALEAA